MRKEFIEADTKYEAVLEAPWAAIVIKREGGYMAYESIEDYVQDRNQV